MQITLIVIGVIVGLIAILFFVAKRKLSKIEQVPDSQKIITLTDKNFANQTKNKLILVDFWAPWCAPCRMMAPVLNELSNDLDKAFVGKLDVE
ncbi:MAG: thioredoxin domain-containing protein, partial [Bacteroidales bacterium]|nr:thioredoxin domain-containing protein [Bacteroidales bacterium]